MIFKKELKACQPSSSFTACGMAAGARLHNASVNSDKYHPSRTLRGLGIAVGVCYSITIANFGFGQEHHYD